jgi:hypothetical protein
MYPPKDIVHQLAEHIIRNITKGYTQDALIVSLMNQGYSRISIEKAMDVANKRLADRAPPMKETPQITYKLIDDENRPIKMVELPAEKKSFWRKIFG